MSDDIKYWVIIPAAGVGARMQTEFPKQYISVSNKTILEYSIDCFIDRDDMEAVVLVVADTDQFWTDLSISKHKKLIIAAGGQERFQSVLNGLKVLSDKAKENDWVLVHDAARPCLDQSLIDRLMAELSGHAVGGILALPCRDTMKRANDKGEIDATVEREKLWHAQTPQMFRYRILMEALDQVVRDNISVTDEAMSIELSGYKPMLVQGDPDNIKLTHEDDLKNIAAYLKQGVYTRAT